MLGDKSLMILLKKKTLHIQFSPVSHRSENLQQTEA